MAQIELGGQEAAVVPDAPRPWTAWLDNALGRAVEVARTEVAVAVRHQLCGAWRIRPPGLGRLGGRPRHRLRARKSARMAAWLVVML